MLDFSLVLQEVSKLAAANASILIIAAGLVSIYVIFKSSRFVLLFLRGGREGVRTHYRNKRFEKRYKREKEHASYRAWKREKMRLAKI
jgi:hypothetical protein